MNRNQIIEALTALKDLRAEVEDVSKRCGWAGNGARQRADKVLANAAPFLIEPTAEQEAYRAEMICAARQEYAQGSDNDIEVDDDAQLSQADDGTWVQAWVWIRTAEDEEASHA